MSVKSPADLSTDDVGHKLAVRGIVDSNPEQNRVTLRSHDAPHVSQPLAVIRNGRSKLSCGDTAVIIGTLSTEHHPDRYLSYVLKASEIRAE